MKKLFVVALLLNLNLYSMECLNPKNKPSRSTHKHNLEYYKNLIPSFNGDKEELKPLSTLFATKFSKRRAAHRERDQQQGCFVAVVHAFTRALSGARAHYLNQ